MTIRDAAAADFRDTPDFRDPINKRTARGPQYCWAGAASESPHTHCGRAIRTADLRVEY
jgi:hypothetical protein